MAKRIYTVCYVPVCEYPQYPMAVNSSNLHDKSYEVSAILSTLQKRKLRHREASDKAGMQTQAAWLQGSAKRSTRANDVRLMNSLIGERQYLYSTDGEAESYKD